MSNDPPVCCYCDHDLSCGACGKEQPYTDVSILKKALREFVAAYKLQDCDNYTEELARAYSIADAALSSGVAREGKES